MSKDINQNIIMTIVAVCLLALVAIVIYIFRGNSPCPKDMEIHLAKEVYEINEEVHLSVKTNDLPSLSSYEWTTKDGQNSTIPSPTFRFDVVGSQEITVRVNEGCVKKRTLKIIDSVADEPFENQPFEDEPFEDIPVVPLAPSSSKEKACVGQSVKFTDVSENASAWWWDFGDAGTSAVQNPSHRYKKPGTYTVTRMLNGEENLISEITITIEECKDDPTPKPKITAGFSMGKSTANVGEIIPFTDKTSPKADSWLWNFGDGYTSHERSPSHVYNYHGTYTVTLSVNGTGKDLTTQTINILPRVVQPPPVVTRTTPATVRTTPITKPVAPPVVDISSQLKSTLKAKLREIAKSADSELKTNIYYNDLMPIVSDENMMVRIVKNGVETEKSFYNYYNTLNIQGGQNITKIEVLDTEAGKVTALRINEQ